MTNGDKHTQNILLNHWASPAHQAAARDDAEELNQLYNNGAYLWEESGEIVFAGSLREDQTSLNVAAAYWAEEAVQYLLGLEKILDPELVPIDASFAIGVATTTGQIPRSKEDLPRLISLVRILLSFVEEGAYSDPIEVARFLDEAFGKNDFYEVTEIPPEIANLLRAAGCTKFDTEGRKL